MSWRDAMMDRRILVSLHYDFASFTCVHLKHNMYELHYLYQGLRFYWGANYRGRGDSRRPECIGNGRLIDLF